MVTKSVAGKAASPPKEPKKDEAPKAPAPAAGTAVAPLETATGGTALATLDQFAGMGFENQDSTFLKVPFLRPLQGQSPSVLDGKDRPGEIINTATGEVYKSGELRFIPSTVLRVFIERTPRKGGEGGDFAGKHDPDSPIVTNAIKAAGGRYGKPRILDESGVPAGNDLVETFEVYGVVVPPNGSLMPAIVPFSSTGIPHFQLWNGKAKSQQGDGTPEFVTLAGKKPYPMFAFLYRLDTVKEENKHGTFFNFEIVPANGDHKASQIHANADYFNAALGVYREVIAGTVSVDREKGLSGADMPGGSGSGTGGKAGVPDEEIPF